MDKEATIDKTCKAIEETKGFGLGFFIGSILGYRIGVYREE